MQQSRAAPRRGYFGRDFSETIVAVVVVFFSENLVEDAGIGGFSFLGERVRDPVGRRIKFRIGSVFSELESFGAGCLGGYVRPRLRL